MEESIEYLQHLFRLPEVNPKQYSPLTLAYIGDAVYELVIRTVLVSRANTQVSKLHKKASSLVKAEKQSELVEILEPYFTPEEEHIYKRGRNAKSYTSAKNAGIVDYRRATGFEAVMGYLYLKRDFRRMMDLIKMGIEPEENGNEE